MDTNTPTSNTTVVKCRTRKSEADPVTTTTMLTITWDDDVAVREFAKRGVVIAWQSLVRAAGVIPDTDTVSIAELIKRTGGGFTPTPERALGMLNKLSPDDYKHSLMALGLTGKILDTMCATHAAKYVAPAPKTKT